MVSLSSLASKVAIAPETEPVYVLADGSVRNATAEDPDDGNLIVAEKDMLPVARDSDLRSWGMASMAGYWLAEGFGISQYQVASASVSVGLSPGAAIGAVLLGHVIISLACAATGYVGCHYGINMPSFARASFGIRGMYLAITVRSVAAIVWFGTQTYQGGQAVNVMLCAIWPSFKTFPNTLPASAHVTSAELLTFFIFYIVQLPLLYIPIHKLRYLFMIKIILMPIFGIALFAWAVHTADGFGPVFSKPTRITNGMPAAAVFFSAMTSAIAPKATLALNVCDFTRYSKSSRTVVYTNIFSLSILLTLCAILGVVVTSATEVIYGKATWNPLQVSSLMGNRAAQFFTALMWGFAVFSTNISANSTAVANDLMVVAPKYINIRRGQFMCAILGLATCPWIIQNSAKSFTSFLGGYSVFLGPAAGIMLADYFIVRGRRLSLGDMFLKKESIYWNTYGVNIRAIAAFVCGVAPTLPGFIRNVNATLGIPIGAYYAYVATWPVGASTAAAVYVAANLIYPPTPFRMVRSSSSPSFSNEDEKIMDEEDKAKAPAFSTVYSAA